MVKEIVDSCTFYGDFELSSGKKSNYYINSKLITLNGEYLKIIVKELKSLIKEDFDCIGGMELGAVPLISALIMEFGCDGFIVRKETKAHGIKSRIEGNLKRRAILIEDVVTTGKSLLECKRLVEELNCEIVGAYAIVDRGVGDLGFKLTSLVKK